MRPLVTIYWLRFALGIAAGLLGALLENAIGTMKGVYNLNNLFDSITVALLIYLASYYIIKTVFASKVEKKGKLMTMGIGIYFFTWIVSMVIFFSIIGALPAPA